MLQQIKKFFRKKPNKESAMNIAFKEAKDEKMVADMSKPEQTKICGNCQHSAIKAKGLRCIGPGLHHKYVESDDTCDSWA